MKNLIPWGLRAATPPASPVQLPRHHYDPHQQINVTPDGAAIPQAATQQSTVVDGNPDNPPRLDTGPDL